MATYLVTGAAGFIGSSIVRELLKRGEVVRGIDNFETGKWSNLEGLEHLAFTEGDICDLASVRAVMRGVDVVLHQAAIPSVPRSVEDPVSSNRANIDGTLNVLVAAREARVRRVVYAASSSAYGNTPTLPKHEGMTPAPISPYAVTKLTGELYMSSFWQVYGLETVSLRYFNIFGPHQDPTSPYSGVLAKFITKMLAGETPTIFGDGEQSRDFTYVENAVQANLLAATAGKDQVAGQVFNVATGDRYTLNETYRALQKIIGFNMAPKYAEERAGDVKHSLADISRARESLGYQPTVGFEEGLRRTVEWYRSEAQKSGAKQAENVVVR